MKKAVFVRLDKIGDLICTLPMDQADFLQGWDITWVIANGLRFVPVNAVPPRKFIELDKAGTPEARQKLDALLTEIKPDIAISFQAPWWVHYALWKHRIAKRIGVLSKWHSFLFLNEGLRQKRSRSIQHEADYNMDLVRLIAPPSSPETLAPVLKMRAEPAKDFLAAHTLTSKGYDVVHPGMAGSALNWPIPRYIELIEKLILEKPVVLTGTPADEPWLKEIKAHFKENPRVLNLQNALSVDQLLSVLAEANCVYAPSTGVLHLAASLGTKTVGFYSPVRVQTTTRWGARGPHVKLFTPNVPCPAIHQCLGEKCPYYYCMNQITPEQVLAGAP